jgi:hypothetical protein
MVLLSQTKYPVETGLQAIFEDSSADTSPTSLIANEAVKGLKTSLAFFIFSTVWSFKSSALTAMKIKNETKLFLPLSAKLLLFLRYLLILFVRVGCIVTYYSPFLGLLDILNHHKAESVPLEYNLFKKINDTDDQSFHYWNPIARDYQHVKIAHLFRSNYTNVCKNDR